MLSKPFQTSKHGCHSTAGSVGFSMCLGAPVRKDVGQNFTLPEQQGLCTPWAEARRFGPIKTTKWVSLACKIEQIHCFMSKKCSPVTLSEHLSYFMCVMHFKSVQ